MKAWKVSNFIRPGCESLDQPFLLSFVVSRTEKSYVNRILMPPTCLYIDK